MEQFTFYDLETTGTDVRYDVPIQFAAVRTNGDLSVIDEVEFRGRPPVHILPAPGALTTTRQPISNILAAPNSFNQFMGSVEAVISGGPPSCMVAFNGIRFDEEMLRHSFYQSLRQPYQTQFGGNTRADAMLLIQATSIFCPGAIQVPLNDKGGRTFRLEMLAEANGLQSSNAHDALVDVRMMLELVRLVRDKASQVWEMLPVWTSKAALESLLRSNDAVLRAECFGGTGRTRSLYPLCPNPSYQTEWALIDLALEPSSYLRMSPQDLLNAMKPRAKLKPIFRVKTNGMPMLVAADSNLAHGLHSVDESTIKMRARMIRSDATFAERVAEALKLSREYTEEPLYVEDRLYSDGFFPISEDESLIEEFHAVPPISKQETLSNMHDPRARQLGERLLFDEWPEALAPQRLASMRRALFERLTEDHSVPWMTVPKALREIVKLRVSVDPVQASILDEYKEYLAVGYGRLAAE